MAKTFTKCVKVSYNPFADVNSTPRQKMEKVFTPRQLTLIERPDVTKSLIVACAKCLSFKQELDVVVAKWVGQSTEKFMRTLPLLVS